ncbi:MAG: VWA domain-containing protein [Opitutus sp.]
MKQRILFSLAATLISAMSLAVSAKSTTSASATDSNYVQLRIDVDRGVLPAESTAKAVVKIGLDCARLPGRDLRPPVNLSLVIDRSGSMSGEKIASARNAALEAIRRLGPDDIVSLVVYDTQVQTLIPAQRLGTGREIERAICGIEVGGNTALYGGVSRGATEVRRHAEDGKYVNRIILLSDGLANVGPSSAEELGRLGASLMKEGISVTTIGLGLGFNEDLMTRLAQRSDGNTYFVENSEDLSRIFAAELGDVLNVVARRVVIEIDFPEGVRPLSFVGREGTIRGQRAELALNQLYGGQEKFALVEVEVSPSRSGVEREIARAQVTYEDAINQKSAKLSAKRTVQFSSSHAEMVSSANHQVQADYATNIIAVAKDEAVALVDANKREAAAGVLRQRTAELQEMAKVYRNTSVGNVAAAAAPEADRLEKEGLGNAQRKAYRADSTQAKAQQASTR